VTPTNSAGRQKDVGFDLSPQPSSPSRGFSPYRPSAKDVEDRFIELVKRQESLKYKYPSPKQLPVAKLRAFVGDSLELRDDVVRHSDETYPVLHRRAAKLANTFLAHKKEFCSPLERPVYHDLQLDDFVNRLLVKRPVAFFGKNDKYLSRKNKSGKGGFHNIGTANEVGLLSAGPLLLADHISYEEMEVSALIGMTGPTNFINAGHLKNNGKVEVKSRFVRSGVYIGQVGCRLEREERMERKYMVVNRSQNTPENGYGEGGAKNRPLMAAFATLYGVPWFCTYKEAEHLGASGKRFVRLKDEEAFLDTEAYKGRCLIMAETFLADANERAAQNRSPAKAFCHIVGLGLGAWQVHPVQAQIQADAYATALRQCNFPHIGALFINCGAHPSCFPDRLSSCGGIKNGDEIATGSGMTVQVMIGRRDPADVMPRPPDSTHDWLLVAQYAWDANSYPGNEYWAGKFDVSSGTAAACCSTIASLHNPDVNPEAADGGRVALVPHPSAQNSRAASPTKLAMSKMLGVDGRSSSSKSTTSSLPEAAAAALVRHVQTRSATALKAQSAALRPLGKKQLSSQHGEPPPMLGPEMWDGEGASLTNQEVISWKPPIGLQSTDGSIKDSIVMKNRKLPPKPSHPPNYPNGLAGEKERLTFEKYKHQREMELLDPNPWEEGGCGTLCEKLPEKKDRKHDHRLRFDLQWKAKGLLLSEDLLSASCRRAQYGGVVMSSRPVKRQPYGRWFEVLVEEVDSTRWSDGLGIGIAAIPHVGNAKKNKDKELDDELEGYANEILPDSWMLGYDGRAMICQDSRYIGGQDSHKLWPENSGFTTHATNSMWRPRNLRPGDVLGYVATPEGSLLLFVNDELVYHVRRAGVPWNVEMHATVDLDGSTKSIHLMNTKCPSPSVLERIARIRAEDDGRPWGEETVLLSFDVCYDIAKAALVEEYQYPAEIGLELKGFDPLFANAPRLLIHEETCSICKINHWYRASHAVFGREQVDPQRAEDMFKGPTKASEVSDWDHRFRPIHALYGQVQACLVADVIHWFRAARRAYPQTLINDVFAATEKAAEEAKLIQWHATQHDLKIVKDKQDAHELLKQISPLARSTASFKSTKSSMSSGSASLPMLPMLPMLPAVNHNPGRPMSKGSPKGSGSPAGSLADGSPTGSRSPAAVPSTNRMDRPLGNSSSLVALAR